MSDYNMTDNPAMLKHHIKAAKLNKPIELTRAEVRLMLSFCPSGDVPKGLSPEFYHTLSYEKECEINDQLNIIRNKVND